MGKKNTFDWIFRFIKGMFIGTGAILPGVSGGALAAVFGFYEQMISFLANITKDFKKNVLYFLPVGLGGVTGIFVLSFALSFFLENYEAQILWFFIGCIVGILPALFEQANRQGRKTIHLVILGATAVIGYLLLFNMQNLINGSVPLNFFTWIGAGAIFGLGLIVPGLSPSNFLVYLNMYKPMTDGIKNMDFMVVIPLLIGALLIVLLLSKLMNFIFERAYTGMYHFIIGIIFASTVMIIPANINYLSFTTIFCAAACGIGVWLGLWMSALEKKYKPED